MKQTKPLNAGIATVLKPVKASIDYSKPKSKQAEEYEKVLSLRFSDEYIRDQDYRLEDLTGHNVTRKIRCLYVKGYNYTKYKLRTTDYTGAVTVYNIIRADPSTDHHYIFLYLEDVNV